MEHGRSGRYAAAVALAGLALLAAGCGGSGPAGVASVGSTSTAAAAGTAAAPSTFAAQAVRYARCMRSHGVTRFPDPTSANGGVKLVIRPGSGVDPTSATFRAARKACASVAPTAGAASRAGPDQQQLAGALSFSKCMRRHGVARFPDPTSKGLTLEMVQAAGVDVRAPSVVAAAQACLPAAHGAITAAQIKRAEAEAAGTANR